MTIKLKRLTVNNFKGLRKYSLDNLSDTIEIHGDNGEGKTTLYDAYLWLLFGKDSSGQSDFSIKTLTPDGEPINKLTHSVEGVFDIDNMEKTFKREYREKWQTKKGDLGERFTGHESTFFIDGTPVNQTDYNFAVSQIIPPDVFRLLSDIFHFNNLKWEKRREIILEVAGQVSDAEIFASHPEFKPLASTLKVKTLSAHKATLKATVTKLKDQVSGIPDRIDELKMQMPDKVDTKKISDDIAKLEAEIKKIEEMISSKVKQSEASHEKFNDARSLYWEAKDKVADYEREASDKASILADKAQDKKHTLISKKTGLEREIRELESNIIYNKQNIEKHEGILQKLRERYLSFQKETFVPKDNKCPTCKREWEDSKERLERAQEEFNNNKADTLSDITKEGDTVNSLLVSNTNELAEYTKERDKLKLEIDNVSLDLEALNEELSGKSKNKLLQEFLDNSAVYQSLLNNALKARKAYEELTPEEADVLDEKSRIQNYRASVDEKKKTLAHNEVRESHLVRIDELKEMQKKYQGEIAENEKELFMVAQFEKAKVEAMYDKITDKFPDDNISFLMYRQLVNGGEEPACETLINGVPWRDANHGAKINAGISIIKSLSGHYGYTVPVWVDNAEAVVRLNECNSQIFKLYAQAGALKYGTYESSAS